jgi:hypothetical protein
MSATISEPSFVAVNAAVLTGTVVAVPPPSFLPQESPEPSSPPAFVAPKKRDLNDGRKWLAVLLLITAAGGTTAVVLNPALRPSSVAFSSLSTVRDETPVEVPPPPVSAESTPTVTVKEIVAVPSVPIAPSPAIDNPRPSPADDGHLLWQSALNAESHRDFETAVKLYERLESLPNTQWPPGLHTRLALARQELVAGLR